MKKGTAVGIILTVFFCMGILVTIPALSKQTNIQTSQEKKDTTTSGDKDARESTSQAESKQPTKSAVSESEAEGSLDSSTVPSKGGFTIIYDKDGNQVPALDKYGNEILVDEVTQTPDN
ncbi:hypothetical protein NNA34_08595 [Lacticaseibacillus paracasei]|uniref:hypothetical protein n=1 Tax=Lacticaseibacillus paracasei TaxID=1597 RepID=UPI00209D3DF9|nr:hypothetical protein [Lacticaseibacillus paracasei]MDS0490350.1 hypothetical protein [Lacticaseibacillus paracasei]UVH23627.1 hypothetical protein NJN40_13490 [Lacticaseibacillus paracasei]